MAAPAAALAGAAAKALAKRALARWLWKLGRKIVQLVLVLTGLTLSLLALVLWSVVRQAALADVGPWGYPAGSGVPQVYWQMYTAAAERYQVSPYLLASIHTEETSTSTSRLPGVRSGWNGCGAAGPMQFGVVGVPPYNGTVPSCPGSATAGAGPTWKAYADAVKPIEAARPASYRLQRDRLPSCRPVPANVGCVYDDFDAIAGAAKKLKAGGATKSLTDDGTREAILAYNGSVAYVDRVLAQARIWEAKGMSSGVGAGGARAIVEHAVSIAMRFGSAGGSREGLSTVYVCSDYRPGSTTTGGNSSDHSSNNEHRAARDIAYRGRNCLSGPPSPVLDQAAVAIGQYFGRSYVLGTPILADTFVWNGYRIQIIWRTPQWGDHRGHIHIGAQEL